MLLGGLPLSRLGSVKIIFSFIELKKIMFTILSNHNESRKIGQSDLFYF